MIFFLLEFKGKLQEDILDVEKASCSIATSI